MLCHTPGLTLKLHSIWEGPNEVIARTSSCNNKVPVPGEMSKNLTVQLILRWSFVALLDRI